MRRKNRKRSDSQNPLRPSATIREWVKSAIFGLMIFLVVRTVFVQTFTIISGSMENTLLIGDFLVLNKAAYGATVPGTAVRLPGYDEPRRGDVVVFKGTAEPIDLVKRIVGMPGDTIAMKDGRVYVNGGVLTEPYVRRPHSGTDVSDPQMQWQSEHLTDPGAAREYEPTNDSWGPLLIPGNHYFMLGDNRHNSRDSRYWGFIPRSHLQGRVEALYFSWERGGGLIGGGNHIRWRRIGHLIR